jgi:GNAT superfamily N-acetyltransferase
VFVLEIQVFYHESDFKKCELIDFLHEHLGEYGDKKEDIERAINYAMSGEEGRGGFVTAAYIENKLIGCVVINDTAMKGYIPQHMLVYITVHKDYRGRGIGKQLIKKVVELCSGNIALHVEYDNPARLLYRRLGFESKYAEMRYVQKDETERKSQMERRIRKKLKKDPDIVKSNIDWLCRLNIDDIDKLEKGFKKYLNNLVLWATDWDDIFADRTNKLTKFAEAFADMINIPFDQQILLNKVQKEFYNAIDTVVRSSEWDFSWEEFLIMIQAAKNVKKEIESESE